MKEVCLCATILCEGKIYRGHRHANCIAVMHDALSWTMNRKQISELKPTQGFLTSHGRHVNREEGYKLQIDAGMKSVSRDGYRGERLYSEDLY